MNPTPGRGRPSIKGCYGAGGRVETITRGAHHRPCEIICTAIIIGFRVADTNFIRRNAVAMKETPCLVGKQSSGMARLPCPRMGQVAAHQRRERRGLPEEAAAR